MQMSHFHEILLRIKIRFFDGHRVMKPVGGAKIVQEARNTSYINTLYFIVSVHKLLWLGETCELLTNVFGHYVKQPSS